LLAIILARMSLSWSAMLPDKEYIGSSRAAKGKDAKSDDMPLDVSPAEMFMLLDPLATPSPGHMDEPLRIHLNFDTGAVDEMLERLAVLRGANAAGAAPE
jgi:hypothetical protein